MASSPLPAWVAWGILGFGIVLFAMILVLTLSGDPINVPMLVVAICDTVAGVVLIKRARAAGGR